MGQLLQIIDRKIETGRPEEQKRKMDSASTVAPTRASIRKKSSHQNPFTTLRRVYTLRGTSTRAIAMVIVVTAITALPLALRLQDMCASMAVDVSGRR